MPLLADCMRGVARALNTNHTLTPLARAGTLGITYRRRRRERVDEVRARLSWLRALLRVEDDVTAACAESRFVDAVRVVVDGAARLADPLSASYTAAASLRSRFNGAVAALQDRLQAALEAQLMAFEPTTCVPSVSRGVARRTP